MSAHIYRTTTTHHPDRYQPQVRRSPLALDAASWRHPHLASTLASIGVDGASSLPVPLWATRHTAHSARLHTLTGHGEWILAVKTATGEDGVPLAVTASYDRTARVWNPVTGELLHTLDSHNGPVTAVATATAQDGTPLAVTSSKDGNARVWNLRNGKQLHTLTGHDGPVTMVSTLTTPDGTPLAVTTSYDRTAIIWNPVSGERLHTLTGHTRGVKAIATTVSSDGTPLAVTAANDRTAIVWNLETGRQLHTLTDLPGRASPRSPPRTASPRLSPQARTTPPTSGPPRRTHTGPLPPALPGKHHQGDGLRIPCRIRLGGRLLRLLMTSDRDSGQRRVQD